MTIKVVDRTGKEPFVRALEDEEFEMIVGPWRDLPSDVLEAMERAYWKSVEVVHDGIPPDFADEKELTPASALPSNTK